MEKARQRPPQHEEFTVKHLTFAAAIAMISTPVLAAPLALQPANPQPTELTEGLAVSYAYPKKVKTLEQAEKALKDAKPGAPLAGLDYLDTIDGMKTLTSDRAHNVAAAISGYVKFDEAGTYIIDFLTNDGLHATVGGQEVAFFDGRHPCEESEAVEVEVPSAGWYDLTATYFQKSGTACLHMRSGMGEPDWMENSSFGYVKP
jgi:hypothetical protein